MPLNIEDLKKDGRARCACGIAIRASLNPVSGSTYVLALEQATDPQTDKLTCLYSALHTYFRWVAEGEKPYRHAPFGASPNTPVQHYHDTLHKFIEYLPAENCYKFSIQIYDSPEGDTWWRGKFRLWGGAEIKEVFEESTSAY